MSWSFANPATWAALVRRAAVAAFSSRATLRSYFQAVKSLRHPVLAAITPGGSSLTLGARSLRPGNYQLSLLYLAKNKCWGNLSICSGDGIILAKESIDSDGRYARIPFSISTEEQVYIRFEPTVPSHMLFFAYGLKTYALHAKNKALDISFDAICASIATHPPRLDMLKESVDSLAPQVDHLFIYLNNYRQVPDFLVAHEHRSKIHYILDTSSTFRAAAKFFWLAKHRCYWLLCDDDIIYPPDYARTLVTKLQGSRQPCVLGVHGLLFHQTITHYYKSIRKMLLFEQKLEQDTPVHMLGTGTLAMHSSLFTDDELTHLLSHPIENDEMFAILCREKAIPQIAIKRAAGWLRSNPAMKTGLFEETMLSLVQQRKLVELLKKGEPWPTIPHPQGQG
jgi:hypothetical protein